MDISPEFLYNRSFIHDQKIKGVEIFIKYDTTEKNLIEKYIFNFDGNADTMVNYKRQLIYKYFYVGDSSYSKVYDLKTGKLSDIEFVTGSEDQFKDSFIYENGKIVKVIRNLNEYEIYKYNDYGLWTDWFSISNLNFVGMDSAGFQLYDTTKWDTIRFVKNEYWNGIRMKKKVWRNVFNIYYDELENYYDTTGNLLEHNYYVYDHDSIGHQLDTKVTMNAKCVYESGLRKKEIWLINSSQKRLSWVNDFEYTFF